MSVFAPTSVVADVSGAGGNAPIAAQVVPLDDLNRRFSRADVTRALDGTTLVTSDAFKAPGKQIIAIISSTFTDTMYERNLILGPILISLREEIISRGYDIEIQFVDMRYGVRDENTLEHETWLACALEIERCRRESEGTFFVSLQSQKYGYQMAPKRIPCEKLHSSLATMNADMKLTDLPYLAGAIQNFRQLLHDTTHGIKTDVFQSLYEVVGNDVCLKRPHFFLALKTTAFGVDVGMEATGHLEAKYVNGDLQQLASTTFADDKMEEIFRRHIRFFETVTVKELIAHWYQLDTNSSPPQYELRFLTDCDDPLYWKVALPVILYELKDMSFEPERNGSLLIARSVTEYETRIALESEESSRRCFWFHRLFAGGVTDAHSQHWLFDDALSNTDTQAMLGVMKQSMTETLAPLGRVKEYTNLTLDSLLANDVAHKSYLEAFQNDFMDLLRGDIEAAGVKYKDWVTSACGLGIEGKHMDEILHHVKWAQQKISSFEGREELVHKCMDTLSQEMRTGDCIFNGVSLTIVGVSGSGKTALASYVSKQLKAKHGGDIPLIIRFCGTSSDSSNGFALVKSICLQIHFLFYDGDSKQKQLDDIKDYDKLVKYFQHLLKKHPLFLVIDSLDQLSNNYKEQSEISFLKGVDPHPDGRIIVSTIPYDVNKYRYLCSKRLDASKVPRVDVEAFVKEDDPGNIEPIRELTKRVLAQQHRSLTQEQWNIFDHSVVQESTALYMNLSVYVMSVWKSFDCATENVLVPTVHGIINQIFDGLEKKFGKVLMQAIIAYLSFAVDGVSDIEMVDLLSIDDEVLTAVFQYSRPDIERLPYHVWLRVRTALGPLLVKREGGAFGWYHRQLKEVGRKRYHVDETKKYSGLLGHYFGNLVDARLVETRNIQSQPRYLNNYACYSKHVEINKRRCIEACHHLIAAGMYREAAEEMFSVAALFAHCRVSYAHCFDFLKEVIELHKHAFISTDVRRIKIDHYKRFLLQEMTVIAKNPEVNLMSRSDLQPFESQVYRDFHHFYWNDNHSHRRHSRKGIFAMGEDDKGMAEDSHVICRSLGARTDTFTPLIASLEGHTDAVGAVAVSPDGQHVISGSEDKTVRIWDRMTGECVTTLEGHTDDVTAVAVSPDGQHVISGSPVLGSEVNLASMKE